MAKRKAAKWNPYSPEDIAAMEDEVRKLHDLLPMCDACDQCGVCVDEQKKMINALIEQYMLLLRNFAPPKVGV